jgi:hypothetical protein
MSTISLSTISPAPEDFGRLRKTTEDSGRTPEDSGARNIGDRDIGEI